MKFVDEYRDPQAAGAVLDAIRAVATRPWTIMEICGGQTRAIVQSGLDRLLPETVTLVHGPGCPVCVTPASLIDQAIALAQAPETVLCSFGDMLRVPGGHGDLLSARARGGAVRVVYSPLDALRTAAENPSQQVVFFAVGFETTAPATATVVCEARRRGIENFSILSAHVRVPPAIEAILSAPSHRVRGFLAPGHVCTVTGWTEYEPLAARFGVPFVVTGFEPLDLLQGIYRCLRQLERGEARVENQYGRCARRDGNPEARRVMDEVFEPVAREWRGIGVIDQGGLAPREPFARFDAQRRFDLPAPAPGAETAASAATSECIAGLVLQGAKKPVDCPAFATRCSPEHPLGAPMVSSEGACAAYYQYGRMDNEK
jgi:hydrogenase expression/formation protein HypD